MDMTNHDLLITLVTTMCDIIYKTSYLTQTKFITHAEIM